MGVIYTIGHSTRTLEELIAALRAHGIRTLVDIRAFPMSRRLPHFNREWLEAELPKEAVEYVWKKEMGGHRKKSTAESPNTGLRNESFRNYADYMLTPEFQMAAAEVRALTEKGKTAVMCAERVYFHCHRMLVSDYYVAHGDEVLHIDATGPARPHKLTREGHVVGGQLIYNAGQLF